MKIDKHIKDFFKRLDSVSGDSNNDEDGGGYFLEDYSVLRSKQDIAETHKTNYE